MENSTKTNKLSDTQMTLAEYMVLDSVQLSAGTIDRCCKDTKMSLQDWVMYEMFQKIFPKVNGVSNPLEQLYYWSKVYIDACDKFWDIRK